MKDEDCTIHTTQLFRNRRELDPFLKNVFPAGFCKHKHSETMPVRGKLEVSVPRVSPVGDYRRDFISIFNQKQRPCDEMTDVSGSYVDVRDEYADVAGPFFSDINRGSATVPGKHSTTFKRHVKSSNKDKVNYKLRKDTVVDIVGLGCEAIRNGIPTNRSISFAACTTRALKRVSAS